jgi:hypothetical protein
MKAFYLLALTACSGDAFVELKLPLDAETLDDAAADTFMPLNDGAIEGGADASTDVGMLADAGKDAAVCTPFPPDSGFECYPPFYYDYGRTSVPLEFCSTGGRQPTPAECRCKETYNCACINAHYLCNPQSCGELNGHVTITCN